MTRQPDPDIFAESAKDIRSRLDGDMEAALKGCELTLRQKLALGCRILADEGHSRALAGQITVLAESLDEYWTTPLGTLFSEVAAGSLLRVNKELRVMEGEGMPNPAVRFHLWIYNARPDVRCIVHTHAPWASALSMTGEPLAVSHMDAMMFHDDCAWLAEWPGVPVANEEGRLISEALGQKRAILLAHHGLLTAGRSLEEAVYLAVLFERAAQLQLMARPLGPIRKVREEEARAAHDFLLKEKVVEATFAAWARPAAKRHPEALD
jgi:L-fuculose-phosphate aldolase